MGKRDGGVYVIERAKTKKNVHKIGKHVIRKIQLKKFSVANKTKIDQIYKMNELTQLNGKQFAMNMLSNSSVTGDYSTV